VGKRRQNKSEQSQTREQFRARFQVTDTNLETGSFRGFASVFGSPVDAWMPTIVDKGAFAKTLQADAQRVKILWQHDSACPIGIPVSMQETDLGLEVVGKISMTDQGREALTLMRDGVVDGLSIGFDPVVYDSVKQADGSEVRHLKEVKLWEFSVVTFPADSNARISAVHSKEEQSIDPEERLASAVVDELLPAIEKHEGKVLSKKNATIVTDAIAALQKLLEAAMPPTEEDSAKAPAADESHRAVVAMTLALCDADLALGSAIHSH